MYETEVGQRDRSLVPPNYSSWLQKRFSYEVKTDSKRIVPAVGVWEKKLGLRGSLLNYSVIFCYMKY